MHIKLRFVLIWEFSFIGELRDTFCCRKIKVLLPWLWFVYPLQVGSESSLLVFISFVRKEFLLFENAVLSLPTAHQPNSTSSISQHPSNNSCQGKRGGEEKKPCAYLRVCLNRAHAALDSWIRRHSHKCRQER